MRIGTTKVAQMIEGRPNGTGGMTPPTLVIVDESNGNEIELSEAELTEAVRAAMYFGLYNGPQRAYPF